MNINRLFARLFILVLLTGLTACGFQLRGAERMELDDSLSVMHLSAQVPNSDIARHVRNSLEISGAQLVDNSADAPITLWIDKEHERLHTVSVGSAAQATSKNLILTVSFSLKDSSGNLLAGPEQLREERLVQYSVLNVNASDRELQVTRQDLRRKLAEQIVRRLQNFQLDGTKTETSAQ